MRLTECALAGLLLLLLSLATPTLAQQAQKAATDLPQDNAAGIHTTLGRAALEQLAKHQHVCMVAVATIKNRVITGTEHARGCESAQEPAAQPVFEAASLSKPVFAYAVIKLTPPSSTVKNVSR